MRPTVLLLVLLPFMVNPGFADPLNRAESFINRASEADLIVVGSFGDVCFSSGFRSGEATLYRFRNSSDTDLGRSLPVWWMGDRRMTREIAGLLDGTAVILLREGESDRLVLLDLLDEREAHSERFQEALVAAGESPAIERLVEVIGSERVRRFAPDDDRSTLEVIRIEPLPLTAVSADDVIELAYQYALDPLAPISDYSLNAVFETSGSGHVHVASGQTVAFSEREGEGVFRLSLDEIAGRSDVVRPFRVRLYLMRQTSARTSKTVATSDMMEWPVVE